MGRLVERAEVGDGGGEAGGQGDLRLPAEVAGGAGRVIYGTARIVDYSPESGSFIFTVEGSVKVVDVKTGRVLFEKSLKKRATGSSVESARSAAFKSLGRDLGKAIATGLK